MSPGPATYEHKEGFEKIQERSNSPLAIANRRYSFKTPRCNSSLGILHLKEKSTVDQKREVLMQELFTRLVHTVKIEFEDLTKGKNTLLPL